MAALPSHGSGQPGAPSAGAPQKPGEIGAWPGLRGRSVDFPAYSGPLELLLRLIRKNEVDIYDIPIAAITEEYLAEIDAMEQRDLLIAGDFLLMAATLLEIKSALMLPRPPAMDGSNDPGDPRADLVEHLLEYQAFQAAAEELGLLEGQRRLLFHRPFVPSVVQEFGPFHPPAPNLNLASLTRSLAAMLQRLEDTGEPITSVPRERLSLRLRIVELLGELTLAGSAGILLEALLRPESGRLFLIVSFLALLELLRSGKAQVREEGGTHRFWAAGKASRDT